MKYYAQEYEPLEELHQFKESVRLDYANFKRQLDQKKELLFTKDITQWGYENGSLDDLRPNK
jgi:hypothetical protein